MNRILYSSLFFLLFGITACDKDPNLVQNWNVELMEIPAGFPEMEFPNDNPFSLESWTLGKRMFYDPKLSVDSSISCASCHLQSMGFADNRSISPGVEGRLGDRNAPSLANVGYFPYFLREGGVPTLEMQVLVPIQEHAEMAYNIVDLAARLGEDSSYAQMARKAYQRAMDPYVITRAISTFERSLISGKSDYDLFLSNPLAHPLTDKAKRGKNLFFSEELACATCHGGFLLTNHSFENNGLYSVYQDEGKYRLTRDSMDLAKFKVPSLRNVALTAPYMHDGSMNSLRDVLAHYNSGGKGHQNQSNLIRPLHLTETELAAIEAFLESLSDYTFISNPLFGE